MDKNIYKLKPQLMVVICNYSKREHLEKVIGKAGMPVYFMTHGHGSASSQLLDYLGVGEPKKAVALGIADLTNIASIYDTINKEMDILTAGKGIALTVPLSSMNGLLYKVCSGISKNEGGKTDMSTDMEMIMTIVNKGEFSDVMEAAKSAGARGGTMIHAKGLGGKEAERFLGITINQEKDIVMILASSENKHKIMEAINNALSINKAGNGICFALPVSSSYGITEY